MIDGLNEFPSTISSFKDGLELKNRGMDLLDRPRIWDYLEEEHFRSILVCIALRRRCWVLLHFILLLAFSAGRRAAELWMDIYKIVSR